VDQKGPGLLVAALEQVLPHTDVQFVLLGSGALEYEYEFRGLAARYPERVAIHIGFHEPLSERIYAGSDLFLMPSQFEPCGIGQMIALRYGSLPLVRSVGGLRDTVDSAVGFRFDEYSSTALATTIRAALNVYANQPDEWRERQIRAMQQDVSWEASAARYLALYERALKLHQQYHVSAQSS
jgi:starch synthase